MAPNSFLFSRFLRIKVKPHYGYLSFLSTRHRQDRWEMHAKTIWNERRPQQLQELVCLTATTTGRTKRRESRNWKASVGKSGSCPTVYCRFTTTMPQHCLYCQLNTTLLQMMQHIDVMATWRKSSALLIVFSAMKPYIL